MACDDGVATVSAPKGFRLAFRSSSLLLQGGAMALAPISHQRASGSTDPSVGAVVEVCDSGIGVGSVVKPL